MDVAGAEADFKTKDHYLRLATTTLNEIARMSQGYRNLFLARGVSLLLRASLLAPSKGVGAQDNSERMDVLRQAARCFDDALRASNQRSIIALMGKARVQYAMRQYGDALQTYQSILERAPQVIDPDPRIGIGCCLWQLGHKEDAKAAWQRAYDVNPKSKWANIMLGIYHLHYSSQFATSDPKFVESYGTAMTQYTQNAYRMDSKMPLACSTFGGYFLVRKLWKQLEMLARTSIEYTDVNAIASDGWYLLARKEHEAGEFQKAYDHYVKADNARGGDDAGYLPAKFGAAQIKILQHDPETAKFRLDKLMQHSKNIEAQTLLGMLYSESVFAAKITGQTKEEIAKQKDEINEQRKKAIQQLEQVRGTWKDLKKKSSVDPAILLNLARLYELESPEKSLQCLRQVEQIEIEAIPENLRPVGIEDETESKQAIRELLPAPLLNNMGCFLFQSDKITEARETFQTALKACSKMVDNDSTLDTDAFKTTIRYNLARTYEAEGNLDEAQNTYDDLLAVHDGYSDAIARLAFISFQRNQEQGISDMKAMFEAEPDNLEIRALYGWFLNRTKRRTIQYQDDEEQNFHKESLSKAKYDTYVLTSMGNICLSIAREMRGDDNKERRRKTYNRALEFFERALVLDPQDAYAAQGVGIVIVEQEKDLTGAVQIFSTVRETMKDATVFMNLGHVFCELRQFSRAIENYEMALAKRDRVSEASVLASLGRVWFLKGKHEKSVAALQQSLDYSKRVLAQVGASSSGQTHYKFNVALLQFTIADQMANDSSAQRTSVGMEEAMKDLNEAIETFTTMAQEPNPPYPKENIEQRAGMAGTRKTKLERAMEEQNKYEQQNVDRLTAAREQREAMRKKVEEQKMEAERKADEARRKVLEERQAMLERDKELASRQAEEDANRHSDDDAAKKRKSTRKSLGGGGGQRRGKKRRGDDVVVSDGHLSEGEGGYSSASGSVSRSQSPADGEDRPRKERPVKKRRRLQNKGGSRPAKEPKKNSKYKSDDRIVDSDEEAEMFELDRAGNGVSDDEEGGFAGSRSGSRSVSAPARAADSDAEMGDGDESDVAPKAVSRPAKKRAVVDSDDDE
jgi:RNA polymerase-associated protein CTR9